MGTVKSMHKRVKMNAYRIVVGKSEGKRPLRRRWWENNIETDLR
jgi:hypothetical protein